MPTASSARDGSGGPAPPAEVRRSILVPAAVASVWEAVTDPDRLSRWLGCDVRMPAREDATGLIRDSTGRVRRARVVEVRPPRRYVFEWSYRGALPPGEPRSSRVEISLRAEPGGTRVQVVERATGGAGSVGATDAGGAPDIVALSAARITGEVRT